MNVIILLLASDTVIREVMCNVLESEGYCVLAAHDIGSAVDWLKGCSPDLLIVRHDTQNISGHDAAVYLRRKCPGIPVLLVGGLLEDVGLENRERVQGFEIFPKPYEASELLDKVKEVLVKRSVKNRSDTGST